MEDFGNYPCPCTSHLEISSSLVFHFKPFAFYRFSQVRWMSAINLRIPLGDSFSGTVFTRAWAPSTWRKQESWFVTRCLDTDWSAKRANRIIAPSHRLTGFGAGGFPDWILIYKFSTWGSVCNPLQLTIVFYAFVNTVPSIFPKAGKALFDKRWIFPWTLDTPVTVVRTFSGNFNRQVFQVIFRAPWTIRELSICVLPSFLKNFALPGEGICECKFDRHAFQILR